MKISRVRTADPPPAPTFSTAPRAKKADQPSVGVGIRTKLALLSIAAVLVGGNVALARMTQAPPPSIAETRTNLAPPTVAFEIGRFAPNVALRISSPLQLVGQATHLGYSRSFGGENTLPIIVGVLSTSPRCDCSALFKVLNSLAAAPSATYQMIAIDASRIGTPHERATLDEQLALDAKLKFAIGIDPGNPLPPNDIASVWADGVVPSIIVIDHDYRVRYIARGADVADIARLKRALRESVGHYRRERGLSPVVTI